MFTLALAAIVGTLTTPHISVTTELDPLPAGWRADIGAPIQFDDGYVWLYGDTITDTGFVQGTTVITGDTPITNALPRTTDNTFYWPGDGFQLPDGRLFVVVGEIQAHGQGSFDFDSVDTDAFIVDDPTVPASWRWADKLDTGPWDRLGGVEFSDQWPLAFTREHRSFDTRVWQYDPAAPWEAWVELDAQLPESFGTVVPVQTDTGWWAISHAWGVGVALWHADNALGPYQWDGALEAPERSYNHALTVVNGQVLWRYSDLDGTQRPVYQAMGL